MFLDRSFQLDVGHEMYYSWHPQVRGREGGLFFLPPALFAYTVSLSMGRPEEGGHVPAVEYALKLIVICMLMDTCLSVCPQALTGSCLC